VFLSFFFLGATAMDKKSKKQFDAAVLEGLGAKKAKAAKIPTNMAIGRYQFSYSTSWSKLIYKYLRKLI
jgi:hypothetical protein